MKSTFYRQLVAGAITLAVAAMCAGCKPSDKAGGAANADSAASSAPNAASH